MTIGDTLHLGPLNLPLRYLVVLVSLAFGYAVMNMILRQRTDLRRTASNRFVNAVLIFAVVWKFEPMIASIVATLRTGSFNLESAALTILIPGGLVATTVGTLAAFVYLVASIVRGRYSNDGTGAPGTHRDRVSGSFAAVAMAVLPAAGLILALNLFLPVTPKASATGKTEAIGSSIGDLAPMFHGDTLQGVPIEFPAKSGKPLVLNFWATWCPPCRAELPELVRFAQGSDRARMTVWAIDMTGSEESVEAVRDFSDARHINFPIILDPSGQIARVFHVQSVPTTFIIDSHGRIVAKNVGAMSPGWLRLHTGMLLGR